MDMDIFSKLLFVDTETTGVYPKKNGLVQLAGIIDINREVKEEFNILSNVWPNDVVEESALKVNNLTVEKIASFQPPVVAFKEFTHILGKYVDKRNKNDKFTFVGYKVDFDKDFIWAQSKKCNERFFGSYVRGNVIDVMQFVISSSYIYRKFRPENYKLKTIAKCFNIPLEAHDALNDIRVTRKIFYMFVDRIKRRK